MLGSYKFHTPVTQTITLRDRPNLDATPLAQMLPSSGHTTGIFGRGIKKGGACGFNLIYLVRKCSNATHGMTATKANLS